MSNIPKLPENLKFIKFVDFTCNDLIKLKLYLKNENINKLTEILNKEYINYDIPNYLSNTYEIISRLIENNKKQLDIIKNLKYNINSSFIYKDSKNKLILYVKYNDIVLFSQPIDNLITELDVIRNIFYSEHQEKIKNVHEELLANVLSIDNIRLWIHEIEHRNEYYN